MLQGPFISLITSCFISVYFCYDFINGQLYFQLVKAFKQALTRKNVMKIPKVDYSQISKYYDKVRIAEIDAWISRIIEFGNIENF